MAISRSVLSLETTKEIGQKLEGRGLKNVPYYFFPTNSSFCLLCKMHLKLCQYRVQETQCKKKKKGKRGYFDSLPTVAVSPVCRAQGFSSTLRLLSFPEHLLPHPNYKKQF